MSVNVILDSKFGKPNKKARLFDDTERIKKDLENERRIVRIKQVREESNSIAKKIRENVAEEKERQIKKLNDVKQQELNCWRKHVFVKKHQDYRSAIYEVGAAHRAAQIENEVISKKMIEKSEKQKFPQKRSNNQNNPISKNNTMDHSNENFCTQNKIRKPEHMRSKKAAVNSKRKRSECCKGNTTCCCQSKLESDVSSTSETTSSFHLDSDDDYENGKTLHKTPAVILDVEIDSEESLIVNTHGGVEICDAHAETNRQFSRIIHKNIVNQEIVSEEDCTEELNTNEKCKELMKKPRFTQISELVKRKDGSKLLGRETEGKNNLIHVKKLVSNEDSDKVQNQNAVIVALTGQPKNFSKLHFGLKKHHISDKLTKSNINSNHTDSSNAKLKPPPPTIFKSTGCSKMVTNFISQLHKHGESEKTTHKKKSNEVLEIPTKPIIRSGKSSMKSSSTYTVWENGNNCERVKFYDYNNKFHKDYEPSVKSVFINKEDNTKLNATDHAQIENKLRKLREKEIESLRKITEERGQKAIEREQVRRDCLELTEKLDALSRQQSTLVPNDVNFQATHRFNDSVARREDKMNDIMKKLILKPTVVTCPEILVRNQKEITNNTIQSSEQQNEINVAHRLKKTNDSTTISSESSNSILLNYVANQSKTIHSDLIETDKNTKKAETLQHLLDRIEKIRNALINELSSGHRVSNTENVQSIINTIQHEREEVLNDEKKNDYTANENENKSSQRVLNQNDDILGGKQTPVEILIKVSSDGQVKKCVTKRKNCENKQIEQSKSNFTNNTHNILNTAYSKDTIANRQNSIDSNSTSYRSLPPALGLKADGLTLETEGNHNLQKLSTNNALNNINPVVAHYVHRLLGMSRNAIDELAISSSSDIITPSSSLINNSQNVTIDPVADDSLINGNEMHQVEHFIDDNRSFIQELEEALKSHGNQILDCNIKNFDQIWMKRFQGTVKKNQPNVHNGMKNISIKKNYSVAKKNDGKSKILESKLLKTDNVLNVTKKHTKHCATTSTNTCNKNKLQENIIQVSNEENVDQFSVSCTDAHKQMERYAKLTENCTSRIAELTDLIHKVREEKQRLLEVTLTSASETGRNSTEYLELPPKSDMPSGTSLDNDVKSVSPPLLINTPLQKNKFIGISCDSGISVSRPVTSQEQVYDLESMSTASSSSSCTPLPKGKPSPAIRRHLNSQPTEIVPHELSTIAEVDTPGRNSIHTKEVSLNKPHPIPFPSFKQYAQELGLNLTLIDPDQSCTLQKEFNELAVTITKKVNKSVNYQEFPSINAYLQNLTANCFDFHTENVSDSNSPRIIRELIQCLRIANVNVKEFPTEKEYIHKFINSRSNDEDVVNTFSLENLTEFPKLKSQSGSGSNTTESFNVENELKQRNILRSSFRRGNMSVGDYIASSTQRDSAAFFTDVLPSESGIDKISSTKYDTIPSDKEQEKRIPDTIHLKQIKTTKVETFKGRNENDALKKEDNSNSDSSHKSGEMGRTLNLRDFLRKELLKHVNDSNSSSSEDSIKSHFLQSVLESLSTNAEENNIFLNPERQKTSTPVISSNFSQSENSSRSTTEQLFSGESGLSSVRFCESNIKNKSKNKKAHI